MTKTLLLYPGMVLTIGTVEMTVTSGQCTVEIPIEVEVR